MQWLLLTYPLLAHLATLAHSESLAWAALTVFFAVPLLPALRARRPWAGFILLVIIATLLTCAHLKLTHYLMYVPPILIPTAVLFVFARSLRPQHTPLVTHIATQIRGSLPAELALYTRHVTQFWVVLLALLATTATILALCADPALWSLLTNVVQYLLLAAVFLLEYLYRRLRFRHLQHESFVQLVQALCKTRPL